MDFKSWSIHEAVPLSNGVITRRTGLQYIKPAEEISAYYLEHFGPYWFNELPKTDNTYSPTSKYHGCTLAPGIPLIPNLCRRPLRSHKEAAYDYIFSSAAPASDDEWQAKHHDAWVLHNNFINTKQDNGHSNHLGLTKLKSRKLDFQDSGLDSDSDFEDGGGGRTGNRSTNSVTWINWIITTVTTVVTVVTETITGRRTVNAHLNYSPRVPLKHNGGVSWYQYPVLWLYKLAMLVHMADVWLINKARTTLRVESWGTSQQRRRWALILLLTPLVLWAGYKLLELLWDNYPSDGLKGLSWLVYAWDPITFFSNLWLSISSGCSAIFGAITECCVVAYDAASTYAAAAWNWFDGSWLWAPWETASSWFVASWDDTFTEELELPIVPLVKTESEWDFSFLMWPVNSASAALVSLWAVLGSAASSLGEGAVVAFTSIGDCLAAMFAWIFACVYAVPALLLSAAELFAYPLKSMSWEAAPVSPTYRPVAPASAPAYAPTYPQASSAVDPAVLEMWLRDPGVQDALVHRLLASPQFLQTITRSQLNLEAALANINAQFDTVKNELNSKVSAEGSIESNIEDLKQQMQQLQMRLVEYKVLMVEQAEQSSQLEGRLTNSEQLQQRKQLQYANLKEQILSEVREEISAELINSQSTYKVASDRRDPYPLPNPSELEAFVNSTVERLLAIYDADKIAKVDFALATSGGQVLSVRCTETYNKKNAQWFLLGYPLWSKAANDPRIALQPEINAGECWAFAGSSGYLVIELSENITVTAFTLEHLPRSLNPSGTIDTAPKDFKILGLKSLDDDTPLTLGEFRYEDNESSLQHFLAREVDYAYKIVELQILSNHGNLEYTCLYRFRVHGRPARSS